CAVNSWDSSARPATHRPITQTRGHPSCQNCPPISLYLPPMAPCTTQESRHGQASHHCELTTSTAISGLDQLQISKRHSATGHMLGLEDIRCSSFATMVKRCR